MTRRLTRKSGLLMLDLTIRDFNCYLTCLVQTNLSFHMHALNGIMSTGSLNLLRTKFLYYWNSLESRMNSTSLWIWLDWIHQVSTVILMIGSFRAPLLDISSKVLAALKRKKMILLSLNLKTIQSLKSSLWHFRPNSAQKYLISMKAL